MLQLVFALVLSVHAGFISTPEKCLQTKTFPCTVQSQGKTKLQFAQNTLYFSNNSLLELRSPADVYMVRGAVWATTITDFVFRTTYGEFQVPKEGAEFWLHVQTESHGVKVFKGDVEVTPKGGSPLYVSAGKQVSLSSVNYASKSCYASNVTVFDFQEYLRHYSEVFPFGALSVEEHLGKVAGAVLTASSQESQLLKTQAARQLASAIERDSRLKAQQEAQSKLEIYLRKLFRTKSNYED